jgi:glutamate transport system substrate-binding protein
MKLSLLPVMATAVIVALTLSSCGAPGSASRGLSGSGAPDNPYNLVVSENPHFADGTTMASLAAAGTIRVGTKFDQPLFGLLGPGNRPVGFDVAIAALIASKLGIPFNNIRWTETVSANREPFLQSGEVDAVVATYTISNTRKKVIDFAGPYYVAGQTLMVLADNTSITGPDDVAGKPVCSVEGSTPAATIVNTYGAVLVPTDAYSKCLDPLRNGQAIAMTTDNVILAGFVDQNKGEFKLVGNTFTQEPYGIGIPKDDLQFRTFINTVLQESFEDGTWARLFQETAGKVLETPEPPTIDWY